MTNNTFTYVGKFEDVHGMTHTDPVFSLYHYNQRTDSTLGGNLSDTTPNSEMIEHTHDNMNIDYSIIFWINEQARTEGKEPIVFMEGNNRNFYVTLDTPMETHDTIRTKCQDHFLSDVLTKYVITE